MRFLGSKIVGAKPIKGPSQPFYGTEQLPVTSYKLPNPVAYLISFFYSAVKSSKRIVFSDCRGGNRGIQLDR